MRSLIIVRSSTKIEAEIASLGRFKLTGPTSEPTCPGFVLAGIPTTSEEGDDDMTDTGINDPMDVEDSTDEFDSFGIALPPEWFRIPLYDDFENFVRGQRTRLAAEGTLSKTAQRQFELMTRQLRNDCQRADVAMAAVMFTVVTLDESPEQNSSDPQPDSDAEELELLSATCTISTLSRAKMGSELPLTVNTLAAALARIPEKDDGTEVVNLDPPTIVGMPVGRAVKTVRLVTLPPAPVTRERVALFTQQFFVPFNDGEDTALVSFATPSPQHARSFSALFDAMMESFRMFGGDDPTDPLATPNSPSAEPQT